MRFWDAVRELSTRNIRNEANVRFYLGLAGDAEAVSRAERLMYGPDATPDQIRVAREFLELRVAPFSKEDLDRLSLCHLVIILPGGPALVQIRPAPVAMVSHPHDLVSTLLQTRPDWRIALARHFPPFREPVADSLIADISRINAEFAILSSIPSSIPPLAPLFPTAAGANILMLTKNQVLLICRLAAVYGLEIDPKQRVPEIMPILGGAFGWRTAARSIAGLIPGPAGPAINGSIAFAGTYVTGKAAQLYYREGERPSRERMRILYAEAAERARSVVRSAMESIKRLPRRGETAAELPAARQAEEESRARREVAEDEIAILEE